MDKAQIDSYIESKDKPGLYRVHIEKKISDSELIDAILKIDNSVKSKKTNWLGIIHDVIFPSAAH
jgi:hypothetical protein